MEPVTHFLTGACIGRAGLNRKTGYATLAAVLAAEIADLDVLWGLGGPIDELKHHRGISHTFLAVPVEAGLVVGLVALLARWTEIRRKQKLDRLNLPPGAPIPARLAPRQIRWGWLYLTAVLSALGHLALDFTNNYGLRPFYPFNPKWYAGSFVFIAEPVLWAVFLLAMVMPWLFGLADAEIGARRKPFRGRGWAIFALVFMAALWGWRWSEQQRARHLIEAQPVADAPVVRVGLEPYPINPFRWHAIVETPGFYQSAEVNTRTGEVESDARQDMIVKPEATPAVEAARQSPLGQVYLDWGSWAVVRDVGPEPIPGLAPPALLPGRVWTTVSFTDLRFGYPFLGRASRRSPNPLRAAEYIVDGREEAGAVLNGRVQK